MKKPECRNKKRENEGSEEVNECKKRKKRKKKKKKGAEKETGLRGRTEERGGGRRNVAVERGTDPE